MKYTVKADFIEKKTQTYHAAGGVYETADKDRAAYLQKEGFLEADGNTTVTGESLADPRLAAVLEKNVKEIKEAIPGTFSKEDIEEMLKLESDGQNRKTVKEHIEDLLKGDDDESGEA